MWYAQRGQEDKVPFEEWATKFKFMRIVGSKMGISPGGKNEEVDKEETLVEDDTRGEVKAKLVSMMLQTLRTEISRSFPGKEGDVHDVRKATVTKYVAGARS